MAGRATGVYPPATIYPSQNDAKTQYKIDELYFNYSATLQNSWYQIGQELEVPYSTLQNIQQSSKSSFAQAVSMLDAAAEMPSFNMKLFRGALVKSGISSKALIPAKKMETRFTQQATTSSPSAQADDDFVMIESVEGASANEMLEKEVSQLQFSINQKDREISSTNAARTRLERTVRQLTEENKSANTQKTSQQQVTTQLRKDKQELEETCQKLKQEKQELIVKNEKLKKEADEHTQFLVKMGEEFSSKQQELQEQIHQLKAASSKNTEQTQNIMPKLSSMTEDEQIIELQTENKQLQQQVAELKAKLIQQPNIKESKEEVVTERRIDVTAEMREFKYNRNVHFPIMEACHPHTAIWKNIGLSLNIAQNQLDVFAMQERSEPDACISRVVSTAFSRGYIHSLFELAKSLEAAVKLTKGVNAGIKAFNDIMKITQTP
ncbi:MAG: hypothetical protein ACPGUD_11340 [Parashewanella sp.]